MKNAATFLCIFCLSTNLLGQLLNSEFDNWATIDSSGQSYEDLVDWDTNNLTQLGLATMPNVRIEEGADVGVQLTASFKGIDGLYSGTISQYIDRTDLINITYLSKCDSISDRGACVVNIYDETEQLLYTDSIKVVEPSFTTKTILANQIQPSNGPQLKLEFKAFGQQGMFEPFQAYSEFALLNANAAYTSSVAMEGNFSELAFFPNPCLDQLQLMTSDEGTIGAYKILDTRGNIMLEGQESMIMTSSLESGVYYLVVEFPEGPLTSRLIKM